MGLFDLIVESKIKQGQRAGDFDNLPGKGKKLDFSEVANIPPELRMAYTILGNSDLVPLEVQLMQDADNLKKKILNCENKKKKLALTVQLQEKKVQLRVMLERNKLRK